MKIIWFEKLGPARISHRGKAAAFIECLMQKRLQLVIIGGGINGNSGNRVEIRSIENSLMRFPVFPDHAGPVYGKHRLDTLQRDVVNHLIIGALQK